MLRITGSGERPLPGQWVILHGIGGGGGEALDSTRTDAAGRYRITHARSGDDAIQYFVSTVHHGIAYISGAIPAAPTIDDATLTVFDTTSAPIPLQVRGRHVLVFARTEGPQHRVAEIYDITNDTILTRVTAVGGPPLWTAPVPDGAREFSSGPELGSNEAIRLVGDRVAAFSPVAPGLKRIAFTYALSPEAFPATFAVEDPTEILEVLVEDEHAEVHGAGLVEGSPTSIEGRTFRRFQAQAVPAPAMVTVGVPASRRTARTATGVLVAIVAVVMIGALAIGLRRGRPPVPAAAPAPAIPRENEADALARRIAELDAAFDLSPDHTEDERLRYQRQREVLKRRLAERLAASSGL